MAYVRDYYSNPNQGYTGSIGGTPPSGGGSYNGQTSAVQQRPGGGGARFVNLQDMLGGGSEQYLNNLTGNVNNAGRGVSEDIGNLQRDFMNQVPADYRPGQAAGNNPLAAPLVPGEVYTGASSLENLDPGRYSNINDSAYRLNQYINSFTQPGGLQAVAGGGPGSAYDAAMLSQYQTPDFGQYSNLSGMLNSANEEAGNIASAQPTVPTILPYVPPKSTGKTPGKAPREGAGRPGPPSKTDDESLADSGYYGSGYGLGGWGLAPVPYNDVPW